MSVLRKGPLVVRKYNLKCVKERQQNVQSDISDKRNNNDEQINENH